MPRTRHIETRALFEPLSLGARTAPNRIVFGAHQTNFATHHRFEKRHAAYYGARARGGVGLIVLEAATVHPSDWPYEYVIRGYEPDVAEGYRRIADAVHRHGALVFAQLGHSGMQGTSHYSQLPLWAPSPVPEVGSREMPQEMEAEDIAAVVEGFARAARFACDGGLDGIEINAGQSSLIRQFLSPLTNQRGDDYGGTLDNRLRFAREVIAAVRGAAGTGRAVGLRLAGDEYAPWAGIKPEDAAEIAHVLAAGGALDFLSVTSGSIFTAHQTRPGLFMPPGFAVPLAANIKHAVAVPVIAQGSIVDAGMAGAILTARDADAVEMTRALIADPELPAKVRGGAFDEVRPCILCNRSCMVAQVQNPRLSCDVNPAAGYEAAPEFAPLTRAPAPVKVMVVGAGPAGLEAARVAAERGHAVTVYERGEAAGGAVRHAAATLPGRERLGLAVDWLEARLRALNVAIRTGVAVTAELVREEAPAAVIIATGGRRSDRAPYTVEDGAVVRSPREVIGGAVPAEPGRAVILDARGDQVAMGLAEWLSGRGWQVEVVTADMFAGQRLTATQELTPWQGRAAAKGIVFSPQRDVERVIGRRVVAVDHFDRKPAAIAEADLVVGVDHELPDDGLYFALRQEGRRVFRAGDAVAPRGIAQAILEGYRAGREV